MRPWRFNICYSTCHSSSTAYSITTGKLLHSASLLTHPGDGFTLNYGLHVLELFERFWKEHLPGKTPIFIHILQYLANLASKTVVFCRFPSSQSIGRFLENVAHNPFRRTAWLLFIKASEISRFYCCSSGRGIHMVLDAECRNVATSCYLPNLLVANHPLPHAAWIAKLVNHLFSGRYRCACLPHLYFVLLGGMWGSESFSFPWILITTGSVGIHPS